MAATIRHTFVNPVADDPAFNGTKPSDWNANHTIAGAFTGIFLTQDGKTVTVTDGIIISVV